MRLTRWSFPVAKIKSFKKKWKHVAHPTQPYPCSSIVLCWGFARKCLDRRVRDLGNTGWHGAKTILGLWTLERLVLIVGSSLSWMVSISNSFNIDFLGWDELGGSGIAPSLRLKDQSPTWQLIALPWSHMKKSQSHWGESLCFPGTWFQSEFNILCWIVFNSTVNTFVFFLIVFMSFQHFCWGQWHGVWKHIEPCILEKQFLTSAKVPKVAVVELSSNMETYPHLPRQQRILWFPSCNYGYRICGFKYIVNLMLHHSSQECLYCFVSGMSGWRGASVERRSFYLWDIQYGNPCVLPGGSPFP